MKLRDSSLSDRSLQLLSEAMERPRAIQGGQKIVEEHERPTHSTLVLHGWAARFNVLRSGRRQTVALHVAGDFVDLHSFPMKQMDHAIEAVTPCLIGQFPHARLKSLTETEPHLMRVLWLLTLVDAAIIRQWFLGAAQRSSLEHTAHFMCEIFTRLRVVGLTQDLSFELPLTQAQLGEALGISSVHVSRTLSELRSQGLADIGRGSSRILDWDRLCEVGEFDPTYLVLKDEPR